MAAFLPKSKKMSQNAPRAERRVVLQALDKFETIMNVKGLHKEYKQFLLQQFEAPPFGYKKDEGGWTLMEASASRMARQLLQSVPIQHYMNAIPDDGT